MSDETTVRVTYAELAQARGITIAAARRIALRRRWPKVVGNDGLSRVTVPESALAPDARVNGKDNATDDTVVLDPSTVEAVADATVVGLVNATADATHVVATLERALAASYEAIDRERERADRAEARVREVEEELQQVRQAAPARRLWWPRRRS